MVHHRLDRTHCGSRHLGDERITAPRLGTYTGTAAEDGEDPAALAGSEKGLRAASWVSLAGLGLVLWGLLPADGVLRNPETGSILGSTAISAIVVLIALAAAAGIAYGRAAGTLPSTTAVMEAGGKHHGHHGGLPC